ncbi:protein-S-isoprenylcysteine O-methyltransferase Ste14 [Nocardioides thalensis]|uniref:Protein-S-isoprenylcysteine O-methyltransferase Ste14 n=1 Tax=Nocardioides thalensis TaxID=1914755 RepID=A0A853BZ88_9ACTN|nr:isoprenylcysteine carboxylmethyltransferase family protein [Nocardioides thalensis]NYJ00187.1 protein-S-isoprenylcysteine O-methyltransferase Ste14 [Nocardioides thalensis]
MPVVPPPLYAVAGGIAQHLLAPEKDAGALRKAAAGAVAAGSVALLAGADLAFIKHKTTVNPLEPDRATALVDGGPFRLTRNPMYVGMAGLLAAHAIHRGGWLTPLPVAAFVAVIDRTQIPAEEAAMRANFGAAYDDYRAAVPRWLRLPGLG